MTTTTDIIDMAFKAAEVSEADTDQLAEALSWLTFMTEAWTAQGITVSFDEVIAATELNETDGSTAAIISNLAMLLALNLNLAVGNSKFGQLDDAATKDLVMVKAAFPPA